MQYLNFDPYILSWIFEFLTERIQFVQIGDKISKPLTTNTGAPQGCVLSPQLFTIYTNDCRSSDNDNVPILKFADDTVLQGLILNNNELSYRNQIAMFTNWCDENYLELNVKKTKEMVIDFRKEKLGLSPLYVKGHEVEQVYEYKYLGVIVDRELKWDRHINNLQSRLNKRMYFLYKLCKFNVSNVLCSLFYRSVIESLLFFCITVWGGNCSQNCRNKISRIIRRADRLTGLENLQIENIFNSSCLKMIVKINSDNNHPLSARLTHSNFSSRILAVKTKTERHRNSFIPASIRIFNELIEKK